MIKRLFMLKQRIITALILIPIFVFLIFTLPVWGFGILSGCIVLLAAWEWSYLMGIQSLGKSIIYAIVIAIILLLSLQFNIIYALGIAFVFWLVGLLLVVYYPRGSGLWGKGLFLRAWMGIFVLVPAWLALNIIFSNSPYSLLFLFVLIWGADSGAYFVGRKWGKHKLLPTVSPGKTWEGLIGALVISLIIVCITLFLTKTPFYYWPWAILLALITVLFSVLGDLFESMVKRNAGVKDSGRLLPGHGGVLDRIDSLTAAAPIFALGAIVMGQVFH